MKNRKGVAYLEFKFGIAIQDRRKFYKFSEALLSFFRRKAQPTCWLAMECGVAWTVFLLKEEANASENLRGDTKHEFQR